MTIVDLTLPSIADYAVVQNIPFSDFDIYFEFDFGLDLGLNIHLTLTMTLTLCFMPLFCLSLDKNQEKGQKPQI